MACLRDGAMASGTQCNRGNAKRGVESRNESKIGRYASRTLQKRPDLQVVGEATDGLEAVLKAQELQPDLILLDIGLPTVNGIEAARRILQYAPKTKILFMSQERSSDIVQEALRTGACGYVLKSGAEAELLPAED